MRNKRAGYMLIEVLAVVSILTVVLGLAGEILLTCTRLSAFGTRAEEQYRQTGELEEAFRAAVREASAVSPGVGNYRSGADTLVLEVPSVEGRRYIVLARPGNAPRMSVLRLNEHDGALDSDYLSTQALPLQSATFEYDSAAPETARRITLRFTPQGREKAVRTYELTAALGAIAASRETP
jgi:type II secretory pathway pseudopilin PulG